MRKLFLDDYRPAPDSSWDKVVNYESFCAYLAEHGLPDEVSFDHDLAQEHYEIGRPSEFHDFDYSKCTVETGMHCAYFMVKNYGVPKKWKVHSANPAGLANIEAFLQFHDASYWPAPNIPEMICRQTATRLESRQVATASRRV